MTGGVEPARPAPHIETGRALPGPAGPSRGCARRRFPQHGAITG